MLRVVTLIALMFVAGDAGGIATTRGGPFQIVVHTEKGLSVVEDSLKLLEAIDMPVAILGAAGTFNLGKSTLLNVFGNCLDKNCFAVGPSVNPTTRGLWLLDSGETTIDGSKLLLLDTQGLFDQHANSKIDSQIFALSLLISSHLLFNTMKNLKQPDVAQLELLAKQTRLTQGSGEMSAELQVLTTTNLTWVVRDYSLDDSQGAGCADWLEQFLKNNYESTTPRQNAIHQLFDDINCKTLPPPFNGNSREDATIDKLNQHFVGDVAKLRDHVKAHTSAFHKNDKHVNGGTLAEIIRFGVKFANELVPLPSLHQSWGNELGARIITESSDSFAKYGESLHQQPPLNCSTYTQTIDAAKTQRIDMFLAQMAGFVLGDLPKQFQSRLDMEAKHAIQRNEVLVSQFLQDQLVVMEQQATAALHEIPLPEVDENLTKMTDRIIANFKSQAETELKTYANSNEFQRKLQDFLRNLNVRIALKISDNHKTVEEVLAAASKKLLDEVGAVLEQSACLSSKEFDAALNRGEAAFDLHVTNTMLLRATHKRVDSAKYAAKSEAEKRAKQYSENTAFERLKSQVNEFSNFAAQIQPFPDVKKTIVDKLVERKKSLQETQEWLALVRCVNGTQQKQLEQSFSEVISATLQQHDEQLSKQIEPQFDCLKRSVVEAFNNQWKAQFIPMHLRAVVKEKARECTKNSQVMLDDVVELWRKRDEIERLDGQIARKWRDILVAVDVVLLVAAVWGYLRKH